ncbi:lipid-A-disaccharide synthase [Gammaproteobacteria bacterium]|nr:lipid-A-disaccharide synthase [Gammaproteobacteria bacterium]
MISSNIDKNIQIKIAIAAGEKSGDELGGPLIDSIRKQFPDAEFIGLGGDSMKRRGLAPFFDIKEIAVMGIVEPLLRLRKILNLRKNFKKFLIDQKPDLYIGIDSPDFNLPIAKYLKKQLGIKTIQYVSPSVWAWRKGRIKTMESSVDRVFTLFPFESEVYADSSIEVSYIGHPLSYKFPVAGEETSLEGRRLLENNNIVIALLPGSRNSEISLLGNEMLKAAKLIKNDLPEARFLMPLSSLDHKKQLEESEDIGIVEFSYGNSQEVLKSADLAIITSGTATLEALLMQTPCVTVYKTGWLSFKIIKPLLNIKYFSLPNLLANKQLLPELLQDEVTPENMHTTFMSLLDHDRDKYLQEFKKIHISLMAGGSDLAAKQIKEMLV